MQYLRARHNKNADKINQILEEAAVGIKGTKAQSIPFNAQNMYAEIQMTHQQRLQQQAYS